MYDLIIVGGGPAGLAAAIFATRKRLNYLLVSEDLGGKSNYRVYLPEADETQLIHAGELVTEDRSRVEALRHSYKLSSVKSIARDGKHFTLSLADGSTEQAHAVIVATGAHSASLGVPGEKELRGKALGYSSISYSHLLSGKHVFLVGDSGRVLDSAIELSLYTDHVTVAVLAGATIDRTILDRASAMNRVTVIRDVKVTAFEGNELAEAVHLTAGGKEHRIEADAFFIENDATRNSELLNGLLDRDDDGTFSVDGNNMTPIAGLFAAGDVTSLGYEQVLIALGDGARAILSAYRYLVDNDLVGKA
ncbi:MAG: NAD(P)/FAD-dependent oxidoreductase [Spirochaetales bacterium]